MEHDTVRPLLQSIVLDTGCFLLFDGLAGNVDWSYSAWIAQLRFCSCFWAAGEALVEYNLLIHALILCLAQPLSAIYLEPIRKGIYFSFWCYTIF